MIRLEHHIEIARPRAFAYALASCIERFPEFLPGYLSSVILERVDNTTLIERQARVGSEIKKWRSLVRFKAPSQIHFHHVEGPLIGMDVWWTFAESPTGTQLRIAHQFPARKRLSALALRDRFLYKPRIDAMACAIVQAFKRACEQSTEVPR